MIPNETFNNALARSRESSKLSGRFTEWGIEKWKSPLTPGKNFRIFRLPGEKFRQGFEVTCEVVSPDMPAEVPIPCWMPFYDLPKEPV